MDFELQPTLIERETDAVSFLADTSGLSKTRIKEAMTKGAVWLTANGREKRIRRAKTKLLPGEHIAMYFSEKVLATEPPQPTLIADAERYSVWHKPAGLLSSGSRYGDHCAINRVIEGQQDKPAFLVHRLDRFAWGLMVIAHGKTAAANLSRQFEDRKTVKIYEAIVEGEVNEPVTIDTAVNGKTAITHVAPLSTSNGYSLVRIQIETGRKHQIRIHLASRGHAIAGDRQYGSANRLGLQLAAVELAFRCPTTQDPVKFVLPGKLKPQLEPFVMHHEAK